MEKPLNSLIFDEESHTYTLNGRHLMSVTQALQLVDDRRMVDPFYLHRGRFVHKACELFDNNELDFYTVDSQIQPYLDAYIKFRMDTSFMPEEIEKRLFHPIFFYAGTLDRIGSLNGCQVLLDLKSGAKARVDELQLSAYGELCRVNKIPVKKVFDLYLKNDGTYKLEPVDNPKLLLPTFLNILGAAKFKEGL